MTRATDRLFRALGEAEALADLHSSIGAVCDLFSSECLIYKFGEGEIGALCGSLDDAARDYPREVFVQDPLHAAAAAHAPPGPRIVPVTELVAREPYERSLAYLEFYRPKRIEHILGAWFNHRRYATPGMIGMILTRGARDEPFGAKTHERLAALLPSFAAVARREESGRRLDAMATLVGLRSSYPLILAATDGSILWHCSEARTLLMTLHGSDATLPTLLNSAVKALNRRQRSQMPVLSIRLPRKNGADLRCEMQRLDGAVILIELFPEDSTPLTDAEIRVLHLVEQGLHNREIADVLEVSVETVRSHVKHIYKKRGVSSRLELLAQRRLS